MGLIVDKPRTGGSASSNVGNTARRFFNETQVCAQITGIENKLIENSASLLKTLLSSYKIQFTKC